MAWNILRNVSLQFTEIFYLHWPSYCSLAKTWLSIRNRISPVLYVLYIPLYRMITLGTRGFSRARREVSVLAEGRHVFGRRPKPRAAKPREKPLARSGAFYRPRWPLSFFIGLHLRQSDWTSPTVIMWTCTWRNVRNVARVTIKTWQKPETALEKSLAPRVSNDRLLFWFSFKIDWLRTMIWLISGTGNPGWSRTRPELACCEATISLLHRMRKEKRQTDSGWPLYFLIHDSQYI